MRAPRDHDQTLLSTRSDLGHVSNFLPALADGGQALSSVIACGRGGSLS
jgi:hypothetical protein